MPSVQGSRLLVTGHIRPPKALEKGGRQYFSNKVQTNVVTSVGKIGKELQSRIRGRIEAEEFGAFSAYRHGDHRKGTVNRLIVMAPSVETPATMKGKGVQLKVMLTSPVMPWPLMTNWPIGVPDSRHQGPGMTIVPKSGRKSTAHSRTKSGRKSQRKRLVFQWHNAQKQFWGKKVEWPGFGPDILTEELTAARPLLIDASHAAVQRAILDWTKGGSRQAPSTEIINRPRATR